jgi:hypothetical protein
METLKNRGGERPGAGRKIDLVKVKLSNRARSNLLWMRENNPSWVEDISLMAMLDNALEEEVKFYRANINDSK